MILAEIITIDLQHGGSGVVPTAQELFTKYPFVAVLLGLMLMDIATGIISAIVTKKLCSTASYRGMLGKVQILAMIGTAMLMEVIIPNVPWGTFVAIFFCVTEAISITENAANSGVPIPKPWVEALRKAKAEAETKSHAPLVEVVVSETDKNALKEAVTETKQAIREAKHELKGDIHAAQLTAQADAAEAKQALRDSGILKHSEIGMPQRNKE